LPWRLHEAGDLVNPIIAATLADPNDATIALVCCALPADQAWLPRRCVGPAERGGALDQGL